MIINPWSSNKDISNYTREIEELLDKTNNHGLQLWLINKLYEIESFEEIKNELENNEDD